MSKRKRTASDTLSAVKMNSDTSTRLESFSNEVILDIFEYLDGYDLYQAFYGLNNRINTLLRSAQLHIRHHASKQNKTIWDTLISFMNPSQIRALSSHDGTDIDKRILSLPNENLRTICLHDMTKEYINEICQHFPVNNQIKCLSVKKKGGYYDQPTDSIIDLLLVDQGHRFVSLAQLLILASNWTQFPIVSVTFPQLRHLSIGSTYFSIEFLQFLQTNTPNLRSLKFIVVFYLSKPLSIIVNHIHELHINDPNNFLYLQNILSKFPSLRRLHIDCQSSRRSSVIDGTQWQQLIEQYLPHLKQLTIDFDQGMDEDILQTFYKNEFWSTKKIKAKMLINKTQTRYRLVKTIYFGKEWHFGYFDNL
jgi:hypothetical protein